MSIRSGIQALARERFPQLYGQIKLLAAARELTRTGSPWSLNCLEDEALRTIIRQALRQGGTGVDIGASIGDFTEVMSSTSPHHTHHAFEANPLVANRLTQRFRGKNVMIHANALSAESGTTSLYVPPSNTGTGGLRITPAALKEGQISEVKVSVRRLDEYLDRIDQCRMIKLDIEGAELLALKGGSQLISRDRPVVYFECVSHMNIYGYGVADIFDFFAALEYEVHDPFSYLGGLAPLDKTCFADRVSNKRNYNFVAIGTDSNR
jgi:FkbM family methyltransferase